RNFAYGSARASCLTAPRDARLDLVTPAPRPRPAPGRYPSPARHGGRVRACTRGRRRGDAGDTGRAVARDGVRREPLPRDRVLAHRGRQAQACAPPGDVTAEALETRHRALLRPAPDAGVDVGRVPAPAPAPRRVSEGRRGADGVAPRPPRARRPHA